MEAPAGMMISAYPRGCVGVMSILDDLALPWTT